jgi:hypothetical protein
MHKQIIQEELSILSQFVQDELPVQCMQVIRPGRFVCTYTILPGQIM